MVLMRWRGWQGLCIRAFVTREVGGGLVPKPETEPAWLDFGLDSGCMRRRGVLWCHKAPCHDNLEGGWW